MSRPVRHEFPGFEIAYTFSFPVAVRSRSKDSARGVRSRKLRKSKGPKRSRTNGNGKEPGVEAPWRRWLKHQPERSGSPQFGDQRLSQGQTRTPGVPSYPEIDGFQGTAIWVLCGRPRTDQVQGFKNSLLESNISDRDIMASIAFFENWVLVPRHTDKYILSPKYASSV